MRLLRPSCSWYHQDILTHGPTKVQNQEAPYTLAWLAWELWAKGTEVGSPQVLGLLLAPEGQVHQGDQDQPEEKEGSRLSIVPGGLSVS